MSNLIKKYRDKKKKRVNSLKNEIETLKAEALELYRKLDSKDQLIIELYYIKDEKERKIKELLEELTDLREKKVKKKWEEQKLQLKDLLMKDL